MTGKNKIELYTKYDNASGYYVTWERNPIPGGQDAPVLSRETEQDSRESAETYVAQRGSCFKAQRSVV